MDRQGRNSEGLDNNKQNQRPKEQGKKSLETKTASEVKKILSKPTPKN